MARALRIMPVKMLKIPAMMNRAVGTALPIPRTPFLIAIFYGRGLL